MPSPPLPTAVVPSALVPMEFRETMLPDAPTPAIRMPAPEFPEITFSAPAVWPPTTLPEPPDSMTIPSRFAAAVSPSGSRPMSLPSTVLPSERMWTPAPVAKLLMRNPLTVLGPPVGPISIPSAPGAAPVPSISMRPPSGSLAPSSVTASVMAGSSDPGEMTWGPDPGMLNSMVSVPLPAGHASWAESPLAAMIASLSVQLPLVELSSASVFTVMVAARAGGAVRVA